MAVSFILVVEFICNDCTISVINCTSLSSQVGIFCACLMYFMWNWHVILNVRLIYESHTYRTHKLVSYKVHKTDAYENFAFLSLFSMSTYLRIKNVKLLDNIQFHSYKHQLFQFKHGNFKSDSMLFLYLTYLSSYEWQLLMLQTSFSHIVFMTFILAIWHVKSHPNLTETEYMKTSKTFVVLKP